jgi:hypothetical protein
MRDDFERQVHGQEPGPQPDPMLKEARSGSVWVWLIGVVIAGVVVATLVAVSPPAPNSASRAPDRPAMNAGSSTPPQSAMPASRDTSKAPPSPPVTSGSGGNSR